jgi:hypothetical protein
MPAPPTRYDLLAADGDWIDSGPPPEPTNPLESVGPDGMGDIRVLRAIGEIKYDPQVPTLLKDPHLTAVLDYLTRTTMEFDRISRIMSEITGLSLGNIRTYVGGEAKRRLFPSDGLEPGDLHFRASNRAAVLPPITNPPSDDEDDEDPRPRLTFRTPTQAREALEMMVQVDTDEPHHVDPLRQAIALALEPRLSPRARFTAGLNRPVMLQGTDPIDALPNDALFEGVDEAFPERRPPAPDPWEDLLDDIPPGPQR